MAYEVLQARLIFPALALEQPFLPGALVLSVGDGVRGQGLSAGCACCHWDGTASWPSQETDLESICVSVDIHVRTHIYSYSCIHSSIPTLHYTWILLQ